MDDLTLQQKIDLLWNDATNVVKTKEVKLPRKARVSKRKAKKGWIGIMRVDENNNATFEKKQLSDATFKTQDEIIHATDGSEILRFNGKFPFVVQEAKSANPKNFKFNQGENQVYGQRYIRAKILLEGVKVKKAGMNIIIWLLLIGGGIFLISKLFGG